MFHVAKMHGRPLGVKDCQYSECACRRFGKLRCDGNGQNALYRVKFSFLRKKTKLANPEPSSSNVLGSGAAVTGVVMVSCDELFVIVDVPSRFMPAIRAKPFAKSLVKTGLVPPGSENILNPNVLTEVDVPSGAVTAGPYKFKRNESVEPYVKPVK